MLQDGDINIDRQPLTDQDCFKITNKMINCMIQIKMSQDDSNQRGMTYNDSKLKFTEWPTSPKCPRCHKYASHPGTKRGVRCKSLLKWHLSLIISDHISALSLSEHIWLIQTCCSNWKQKISYWGSPTSPHPRSRQLHLTYSKLDTTSSSQSLRHLLEGREDQNPKPKEAQEIDITHPTSKSKLEKLIFNPKSKYQILLKGNWYHPPHLQKQTW